jgi:hypothetical protein
MTGFDRARRRFLMNSALSGLGFLVGIRAAHAFGRQPMTDVEHKAWSNACSGAADPYHAQLVAAAEADLKNRMSPAEIEQAVAAMRCPICGCALAAAAKPAGAARAG